MHVVAKKNWEPRMVVDLRPGNAASHYQTHNVEPPFGQARGVPPVTIQPSWWAGGCERYYISLGVIWTNNTLVQDIY